MRVIFANKNQRDLYFSTLKIESNLSWLELCRILGVKERMLRFWRSGVLSTPKSLGERIQQAYGIRLPRNVQIVPLYRHLKEASRKGALIRYKLYGNPGTPEGRKRGGLNSLKSLKLRSTNFKFLKPVFKPRHSNKFAELIGILIGDGGISPFQVRVTLGLKTDKEYAHYVKLLFEQLFRVRPSLLESKDRSTIEVVVSSRALVKLLNKAGLPLGNKIKQGIDIPNWIKRNHNFSKLCLRGIFDTDGSVYLDKHRIKGTDYVSMNIAVVSASSNLLTSINEILVRESFTPTRTSKKSIRLRRTTEVMEFFRVVGSKNSKHVKKFDSFLALLKEEYRSGHNGAASKADGVVRPS